MNEVFVGIDLGTTNTLACYLKKGKPTLINFGGGKMLPSVLYIGDDGNQLIGSNAKKQGVLDPLNVIRSSKTYMADFKKTWTLGGKTFTPTDVATEILKEVKRCVVKKLKCTAETTISAVITVPAYFTGNQKDETRKAGLAAGLNVIQIITEPMAAAVAAGHELGLDEKLFVVDLGGGTFDLSVLKADQTQKSYEAIDVDGDKKLGGDDFDKLISDYFISIIGEDLGRDLSTQETSGLEYGEYYSMTGRVSEAAENIKIALSEETTAREQLLNLFNYNGKSYDFTAELTREEFDDICLPLYDKIISRIRKFTSTSDKFKIDEISTVILAGGSCYIPKIKDEVEKIFNKKVDTGLPLETLVVIGACFVAESINGGLRVKTSEILSHSLGVEVLSDDGKRDILSKILPKGMKYPCEDSRVYSTAYNNQTFVPIYVYEAGSDKEDVEDIDAHEYYGDCSLKGIKPARAKEPKIRVTFSYDRDGTLVVMSQDEGSGIHEEISIEKGAERPPKPKMQASIDFMLLLDNSGSMGWYDSSYGGSALDDAKRACEHLFNELIDFNVHRMGMITFESYARRLVGLTEDVQRLKAVLPGITAEGGTNLYQALEFAKSDLEYSANKKVIIIVTDGEPSEESRVLNYAEQLRNMGYQIVAIGAGSGVNKNFIDKVSSPGDNYMIDNMSKLANTFEVAIAKIVEAEG